MKAYEYVNIHIGKFVGAGSEAHRAIIDEYAARGYRYVGYIPTNINNYGKITDLDLVFERDACPPVCGSLHAKKEQGGEKSFLPASSFYFFYTFSPAFSIVSMEIPYPFVASESSTWVTAPTSFPF